MLEKAGQYFAERNKDKMQCYIADATDFAYGNIITLTGDEEQR